ncbi:LysR family transcriptional regulator [Amycolatopsis saalfeldensis]|uniref:DNA-binding transcriptional regulator, LysR family n=1 Tax=Amycolatopsis saalfeldensis TaxID=394193 RepID=A0A1H8T977_9PSEU|nr:LysR family transcriptional regulator [Amycolatopsis saalfeldensis]SEO87088.1 DNA-binding transcriptional regulator, LysR family [Amycolatopsis saalfeldensis]
MDLRQLEIAVAVAEEGGFTAAAQRLHTVQSTVSTVIRALERDLGTALFERTTHRVALTPAGLAFLPAARAALTAAEQARATVNGARWTVSGCVRIGVVPGCWAEPHRVLAKLQREHPAVRAEVRMAQPGELRAAVRESTVDVMVGVAGSAATDGLARRPLRREEMVLVTPPSSDGGAVTMAEAAKLAVVDFAPGWAVREVADRAFREAGVSRVISCEVAEIGAAVELVRHDFGACLLPESVAERFPELRVRRFAGAGPRWDVAAWWAGGEVSAAVSAVVKALG